MKITRSQLKQIIKEEMEKVMEANEEDPFINSINKTPEFVKHVFGCPDERCAKQAVIRHLAHHLKLGPRMPGFKEAYLAVKNAWNQRDTAGSVDDFKNLILQTYES